MCLENNTESVEKFILSITEYFFFFVLVLILRVFPLFIINGITNSQIVYYYIVMYKILTFSSLHH